MSIFEKQIQVKGKYISGSIKPDKKLNKVEYYLYSNLSIPTESTQWTANELREIANEFLDIANEVDDQNAPITRYK